MPTTLGQLGVCSDFYKQKFHLGRYCGITPNRLLPAVFIHIMVYRKLKRTWSNGYANYIPNFKKVFPELSKIDSEELCDRFIQLKMDFYYEEKTPVNFWMRLTLPFAIAMMLLMLIGLPITFLVTGKWGYSLGEKNRLLNWFKALRLQ